MSKNQITKDMLKTIIDNQENNLYDKYNFLDSLIPVKEELTILGRALTGKKFKKCDSEKFGTRNVYQMWNLLLEKDFKVEETDLYYKYDSGESKIQFTEFIQTIKQLAKNMSDDEFQAVYEKVKKLYDIRELCKSIYNEVHIDSATEIKEEKFFLNRYWYLVDSSRLETLSISQIKKFLTPISIVDTTDIIYSATSLTKGLTSLLNLETEDINKGVDLAFPLITKAINGLRKGQLIATGMFSNNGKTRLMIRNIANLVLRHNEKVLIISNEMTKEDIKYCFITTVTNNPEFKEMFGTTDITKNEREIRNGDYKDSTESDRITDIVKILEEKFEDNILVIHTDIYSDEVLTEIILKYYMVDNIDYFFYDTLKADKSNMANWDGLKITTTILSELAKTYDICIWGNIQLINDTSKAPLETNSNDIASSKQIYQLLDTLLLFSPIDKKLYSQYVYWESSKAPTKDTVKELDINNTYYICRVNKNRLGAKPDLLFKVNLNQNTWEELGQVCYRERLKRLSNG